MPRRLLVRSWRKLGARTVVRRENDDGVVAQPQFVQAGEKTSDLTVVFRQHLREVGARSPRVVVVLRLFVGNPGRVHVVGPEVHEAGRSLMAHQKVERLVDEVTGSLPSFYVVFFAPYPVRGGQFGRGIGALPGRAIFVESVAGDLRCIRHVASASHVPFAEVSGGVSCVVEDAGPSKARRLRDSRPARRRHCPCGPEGMC